MQEKRTESGWNESDALLFIAGKSDETDYQTINAFQVVLHKYKAKYVVNTLLE